MTGAVAADPAGRAAADLADGPGDVSNRLELAARLLQWRVAA
jgi:hypothetical protein